MKLGLPSLSLDLVFKLSLLRKGIKESIAKAKSEKSAGGEDVTPGEIVNIILGNILPVADAFGLEEYKSAIMQVVNKGDSVSDIIFGESLKTERALSEVQSKKTSMDGLMSVFSMFD